MRILHLLYESEGDYFGIGGAGIRAYEIYRYLKVKHDITLLCKKYPGARNGEIKGLRHIFIGTESRSLTKTLLSYAFYASKYVMAYGDNYDIIIEDFSPAIPTFLHTFTERPVILQVQGYTGSYYFGKYNPVQAISLLLLERWRPLFYRDFLFISEETFKKIFRKSFSLKESFFEWGDRFVGIIPNGIHPELLNALPEDQDYVLYIGRIDIYSKGLDILLKAYKAFFRLFPHIRLIIAGDGRDKEGFESMLMRLPVEVKRNIEMPGWVKGIQKTDIIRKALFCVFPSRHEVQGIAVLEAMACGKAVIVSDIPEFRYVSKIRAGTSFMRGDDSSLFKSMKDMVVSNERIQMGQRGRDWVKGVTWDKIAKDFEAFLCKVAKRRESEIAK